MARIRVDVLIDTRGRVRSVSQRGLNTMRRRRTSGTTTVMRDATPRACGSAPASSRRQWYSNTSSGIATAETYTTCTAGFAAAAQRPICRVCSVTNCRAPRRRCSSIDSDGMWISTRACARMLVRNAIRASELRETQAPTCEDIAFALLNGSKAAAGIACNCSESSSHTRELRRRVRVSLRRTATRAIDERQVACILIDCLRARRARATARRVRKRRAAA